MSANNSSNNSLPAGYIRFYDNYIPTLKFGDYQISVTQDVQGQTPTPYRKEQVFSVQGPRYALDPIEVHSVFPPPNSRGKFAQSLPQIVMKKRALPWEHPVTNDPTIPWMALLLFNEDEIIAPGTNGAQSSTKAGTYTVSQVISSDGQPVNGILGPDIQAFKYEDPSKIQCRAVDITPAIFTAVLPRLQELTFLAHCRQVDTGDKEILGMKADGWFSVIIGNRLPADPPAGSPAGVRQIVHLVSLEGFGQYLVDDPSFPAGTQTIRLISLAGWVFTSLPETGESFKDLMLGLLSPQSEQGTNLLLRFPVDGVTAQTEAQKLAQAALGDGYVPVSYTTRQGEQTFAWYRGPLTPVVIKAFSDDPPYGAAAQATVYDKTTGLFDQSYAAAWQMGRLLALSDRTFSVNLLNWRRQGHRLVDLLLERINANAKYQGLLSQPGAVPELNELIDQDLVSSTVLDYLVNEFSQQIAPKFTTGGNSKIFSEHTSTESSAGADTTSPPVIQQLKALLADPKVQTLLQGMSGSENLASAAFTEITEWLAHLCLLYGVPFNILVPNAKMLPAESIRFFYVDRNALNAMMDGALSVGTQSSRDNLYQQIMQGIIRETVDTLILQVREKLLGTTPQDAADTLQYPMAGFLLRSAVVSGWPGLEVKAYRQADGTDPSEPIKLLRMERLAPDVLLCLFPETPAWVQIDEPKEGLGFGIEDGDIIGLRYVSGDKVGYQIDPPVNVTPPKRANSPVLDIASLQTTMQDKLNNPAGWGPADFALQMVKAPERIIFQQGG